MEIQEMRKSLAALAVKDESAFHDAISEMLEPREGKPEAVLGGFKIAFANPSAGVEIIAPSERACRSLFKLALSRVVINPQRDVR